jgi:hypothetical protein
MFQKKPQSGLLIPPIGKSPFTSKQASKRAPIIIISIKGINTKMHSKKLFLAFLQKT